MARSVRREEVPAPPAGAERPPRVVVEHVTPEVSGGRFPIKRTVGERVVVEADAYAEGHDVLAAVVRWRPDADPAWAEVPMEPIGNDRWRGAFAKRVSPRSSSDQRLIGGPERG